jgi:F-type H+-transporting ATPase subunit a
MNFWPFLNALRKLLTCGVIAFLCLLALANSPLGGILAEAQEKHPDPKVDGKGHDAKVDEHKADPHAVAKGEDHGGHEKAHHHEPSALAHVGDDRDKWELFMTFGPAIPLINLGYIPGFGGIGISKFMLLELIAALLVCAVYIPLAQRVKHGGVLRGSADNFFEVLLTFVRDQIAKPGVGEHDADKFVPFLWTLFLFILFNNLLGMIPMGGSATASIYVTAGLAICVFGYMHGHGIFKMGPGGYVMSLWPHIDLPKPLNYMIEFVIFVIEWVGVLVRNVVLAIRLFANMFAGHMVLATILIFIYMARNTPPALWGVITLSSVLGIVALSLLELFVAFLQAYIFTFLTALFMGMALHPEH